MEKEKMIRWAAVGVGLVISVVVLWTGLQLMQGKFGRAADLNVTNFNCEQTGDNALLVTWEDTSADKGVIYYRPVGTTNNITVLEDSDPQQGNGTNSHEVTLSLLTAGTTYEVQVGQGGTPTEEIHECSTNSSQTTNSVLPTSSVAAQATPTAVPTTVSKLSESEIRDRFLDGTYKNLEDCASSVQTTALLCAQAGKSLNASGSVSR